MALASLPGPMIFPGTTLGQAAQASASNLATIATGQYTSYIISAPQDMTISHVGFRCGAATGSPTAELRIETVGATGLPSGTLWDTNTNGTTGTLTANTFVLQALTASATITKGQLFCVKLAYASGTSFVVTTLNALPNGGLYNLPYVVTDTGTPTKAGVGQTSSSIALGSSSTAFYQVPGLFPYSSVGGGGTFNNTNSAKRGLRFIPPMKCRVIGMRWYTGGGNGDCNIGIYDDSGTELSNSVTAFDGDHGSLSSNGIVSAYFDNPVTLTAGTAYRVAVEPTSATNCNVSTVVLPSANYRSAVAAGSNSNYATYTSGGGWVDTATDNIPLMDVIIDQLDDGVSSGGVVGVIGG